MKVQKIWLFFVFFLLLCGCFFVEICAESDNVSAYDELLEAASADSIFDGLDEETIKHINELGIKDFSVNSLLDITPKKVVSMVFDLVTGEMFKLAKYIFILLGIIIFIAIVDIFIDDSNKAAQQFNTFYNLFFSVAVVAPIIPCVSNVISAIGVTTDFTLILVPVLAGIITASGNPMLALSFNSLTFAASQLISQFAAKYMTALVGVNLSLCVSGTINPLLNAGNISATIKKFFTITLGIIMTLFVGLLSIRGVLANAADGLAVKGTKFALGAFVPVIGSSLSDGLSSILGSLSLLNTAVGAAGIITIALIVLPSIIEVCIWWIVLYFCAFFCSMLGMEKLQNLADSVSSVIVMLAVLLLFVAFIFIISIGLMLSLKN